jgi:uncharacterized protein (DUF1778 family)
MKGRPKKQEPIKNVGLYIKLTPKEKEQLKQAASNEGMTISAYVLNKTIQNN